MHPPITKPKSSIIDSSSDPNNLASKVFIILQFFLSTNLFFFFCLATHPLFCTYITVAQIVLSKNALIEYGDASISGFEVFKEAKMFKIEESIALAYEYYQKWSPNEVLETIRKENMGKPKWNRKLFGSDSPM